MEMFEIASKKGHFASRKKFETSFNAMSESFVLLLARMGENAPSWGSTLNTMMNEFPAGGILSRPG
jgi:hypothetical protein